MKPFITKTTNAQGETVGWAVESLPVGEYVKRKADSKTVYKRGAYDRSSKTYSLTDCSDINREIFVKRGTLLFFGFTY